MSIELNLYDVGNARGIIRDGSVCDIVVIGVIVVVVVVVVDGVMMIVLLLFYGPIDRPTDPPKKTRRTERRHPTKRS